MGGAIFMEADRPTERKVSADLRRRSLVIADNGRPAAIIDIDIEQEGELGHRKYIFTVKDIFDGKESKKLAFETVSTPVVKRQELEALDVDEDDREIQLTDNTGNVISYPSPENDDHGDFAMPAAIDDLLQQGKHAMVKIISWGGLSKITDVQEASD